MILKLAPPGQRAYAWALMQGRRGTYAPAILNFNVTHMGVTWKELTSEGLSPSNLSSLAEPLTPCCQGILASPKDP